MNQTEINQQIALLNNINNVMVFYYMIIPAPIGILTNAISVIVFCRKKLNQTNMGFYNVCIGISNIATIFYYIFVQNSKISFNVDLLTISDHACKMIYFFRRTVREISPAIETLLSLDRFLEVFYPKRFPLMSKKKFIFALICIIYLILCALSFENLLYYLDVSYSNNKTTPRCTATSAVSNSSDIISSILRTYIPILLLVVFNALIIKKLSKSKTIIKNRNQKREHEFTKTVISINLTFFILSLPEAVMYMIKIVFQTIIPSTNSTMVKIVFAFNMTYFVATSYYMVFFFMNVYFNKLFRSELVFLFKLSKKLSIIISNKLQRSFVSIVESFPVRNQ